MTERTYRGRFAPSPTGRLHLGTARTALAAWLRARRQGGAILLRMEDIDTPRVLPGSAESIAADLAWLGLNFDETSPAQSSRSSRYRQAVETLKSKGLLFPCTCSRKEVAQAASAPHGTEPVYPGTCREHPSHPEREPSWRFRVDSPDPFEDLFFGTVEGTPGDFVVQRSTDAGGGFAYQLACAVDDGDSGITEVVRGDDLLESTSRQIALLKALELPVPAYLHLPLAQGLDGLRLSKRHGSVAVEDYRRAGWSPERVVGMLARGLNLVRQGDEATPQALVARFDPGRISADPWRFEGPFPS